MLITDSAALAACCEAWRDAPWLAVDTEFVREDTYFPQLALVQLGDGQRRVAVDATAVDLAPLWSLLARPGLLKVLHSPSQDLEIFVHQTAACPAPLFDSQIAATLLGLGEMPGYAALVQTLLGVEVDKRLSRTPWLRRPLRAEEIDYALDDVRHLAVIYPDLEQRLREAGRLSWLQEDCAALCEARRYQPDPQREWQRLRGLARLEPRAQPVAAALARWREQVAVARNRPRKWILADEALYRLAERAPATREQLEALAVLPAKTLERHGAELLAVIDEGRARPPQALAREDRLSEPERQRLRRLQDQLQAIATELRLPVALLAPRADLEALLFEGEAAAIPLLRGWRREVAGEALLRTRG
ncbi:MAG TPA: ribonuclease D [Nevskiaceae bacterium]|nr:ribonuclease D [Nevskiaceae bacterium]